MHIHPIALSGGTSTHLWPLSRASYQKQLHHYHAEHWVVVSGTPKVTVGNKETLLTENQSTHISLGHDHRLGNPGKVPLHLIEVQSGESWRRRYRAIRRYQRTRLTLALLL